MKHVSGTPCSNLIRSGPWITRSRAQSGPPHESKIHYPSLIQGRAEVDHGASLETSSLIRKLHIKKSCRDFSIPGFSWRAFFNNLNAFANSSSEAMVRSPYETLVRFPNLLNFLCVNFFEI